MIKCDSPICKGDCIAQCETQEPVTYQQDFYDLLSEYNMADCDALVLPFEEWSEDDVERLIEIGAAELARRMTSERVG